MKEINALRTIGEVSKLLKVPVHVLRFWEKNFKSISPIKNKSGNRYYNNSQIEILNIVKNLLYEKKYTIAGAEKVLSSELLYNEEKKKILLDLKHLIKILKNI